MGSRKRYTTIAGRAAERIACEHLLAQGLELLARNYRCKRGEIDIVMRHAKELVFVEVRYRRNIRFGTPAESVDRLKQARLVSAAMHYLQQKRPRHYAGIRFDVVAISQHSGRPEIDWIQDAFQA